MENADLVGKSVGCPEQIYVELTFEPRMGDFGYWAYEIVGVQRSWMTTVAACSHHILQCSDNM